MTVKELIAKLKACHPDARVTIEKDHWVNDGDDHFDNMPEPYDIVKIRDGGTIVEIIGDD